jgi:hypothetical protein
MELKVFDEGLEMIEATYMNKKFTVKYNDNFYNQWYKLLKILPNEAYIKAVETWCMTSNNIPTPSDIISTANVTSSMGGNQVNIPKNQTHCELCGDTGFVHGKYYDTAMEHGYEYVGVCVCEAGQYCKQNYALPQLDMNKADLLHKAPKVTPKQKEEIKKQIALPAEQFKIPF